MAQQASIPHFATQSRTVLSGSEKQPIFQPGVQEPATATEQADAARSAAPPHIHRWYNRSEWQRRRRRQLRVEPLCRICLEAGRIRAATIADHVQSHRGDYTASGSARSVAYANSATIASAPIIARRFARDRQSARMARRAIRAILGTPAVGVVHVLVRLDEFAQLLVSAAGSVP